MRFPDAHLVQVYSKFKSLGMQEVDAQIVLEPWNAAAGAKGQLQQAWFRVKGIPTDQRSIRTIAKVGCLVGKTVDIDEKTRFKSDYVRVKIACRDVTQVPACAECALGLNIFDFFYEREMPEENPPEADKISVKNDNIPNFPQHKKLRTEGPSNDMNDDNREGVGANWKVQGGSHYKRDVSYSSTPAKLKAGKESFGGLPIMKNGDMNQEAEAPSSEDSIESDDYSLGINGGGCSPRQEGDADGGIRIGLVRCSDLNQAEIHKPLVVGGQNKVPAQECTGEMANNTTEFTQLLDDGSGVELSTHDGEVVAKNAGEASLNPEVNKNILRAGRRTSDRLRKDILLTTKDRIMKMGKKRNLEGLYKSDVREQLTEGVKILLSMACRMITQQRAVPAPPLRLMPVQDDDEEQDGREPPEL